MNDIAIERFPGAAKTGAPVGARVLGQSARPRQKQLHRLRHIIAEFDKLLPEDLRQDPAVRELTSHGCRTQMHVVRHLAPARDGEDHTKDIDCSSAGIRSRWDAGYRDTAALLEAAPWEGDFDPVEGFILHEARVGTVATSG